MKNRLTHIGIGLFVIIGCVPFLAAFIYALLYSFGVVGIVNTGFTTEFWTEVLGTGRLYTSFLYSAAIAAVSVLISVGIALAFTLSFHHKLEKPGISFLMYLPLAIPGIVAAFFALQVISNTGFFSRIFYQLGIIENAQEFPSLVNDSYAIGIILSFIAIVTPFFILLFNNVYKNEKIEKISELSHSLGASTFQTVFRVSIPMLLRKTGTLISLYFLFLFGAYEVPLILGKESPQMLSVLIVREIRQYDLTHTPEGYVIAVIYTVIVSVTVAVIFSFQKNTAHDI